MKNCIKSDPRYLHACATHTAKVIKVSLFGTVGFSFVLTALLYFNPLSSYAQLTKQWDAHYSQVGNSMETAIDNITDAKSNVYTFAQSDTHGVLLKYTDAGELQWTYIMGRETQRRTSPKDFKVDADGNIYALSKDETSDLILIVKINSEGELVWKKEYNDVPRKFPFDYPKGKLLLDNNANVYVIFQSNGDLGLAKFSKEGVLRWNTSWPNSTDTDLLTDASLTGNKIVVTGYSHVVTAASHHPEPLLLVYDTAGILSWKDEPLQDLNIHSGGTYPVSFDDDNGILYVAYSADDGSGDVTNYLVRYTLGTGISLGKTLLAGRDPIKKLCTGSNNTVYIVNDQNNYHLSVTQYTMEGVPLNTIGHSAATTAIRQYIQDVLFDKETNNVYTVSRKQTLTGGDDIYQIIKFNQTNSAVIYTLASAKGLFRGANLSFSANKQNINISGVFDNQLYYDDLFTMQVSIISGVKTWEKPYSPPNNLAHKPTAICHDAQGNSYVAGQMTGLLGTSSCCFEQGNYYGVIKYSPTGEELWNVRYAPEGGIGSNVYQTSAFAVAVNSKNEVIVTGQILAGYQNEKTANLFSIKISPDGQTISENILPGVPGTTAAGFNVAIDRNDNAYILLHLLNNVNAGGKLVVIKYTAENQLAWRKEISDKPIFYRGENISSGYSGRPQLKIINDAIYVGYNTYKYNSVTAWEPIEITKLDEQGNVLFSKSVFDCSSCYINYTIHPLLDFNVDKDGKIYLLASGATGYASFTFSNYFIYTIAMTSTEVLWQNAMPVSKYVKDGYLAIGLNNDVYTVTSSVEKFDYSKWSKTTGELAWSKDQLVYKYNLSGHPCYTFVKTDGNPVFLSSTATENDTKNSDFFFVERSDVTGDQVHYETYDGGSDGFVSYEDQLISFYFIPSENNFVVTGKSSDKMSVGFGLAAQTITTVKYSVTSLKAEFTIDKSKITAGNSTTVADHSLGSPETWHWTFEGGVPAEFTGKNPPAITYALPGNYNVTLKVTKGGKSDTREVLGCIEVIAKPEANFTFDKKKIVAESNVTFTDHSTGNLETWIWTFDGGVPSSFIGQSPPAIRYNTPGRYDVVLNVTTDSESDTYEVIDAIEVLQKLKADFSFDQESIIAGHEVIFLNTSTGIADRWAWEFAGGSPSSSTLNSASTTFASPGLYTVKLTVSNDIDHASVMKDVEVSPITGIENENEKFDIYPNPTSGWFVYRSLSMIDLKLYNSLGAVVKTFDANQSRFNISELPDGIYILKIQSSEKIYGIKLIKK